MKVVCLCAVVALMVGCTQNTTSPIQSSTTTVVSTATSPKAANPLTPGVSRQAPIATKKVSGNKTKPVQLHEFSELDFRARLPKAIVAIDVAMAKDEQSLRSLPNHSSEGSMSWRKQSKTHQKLVLSQRSCSSSKRVVLFLKGQQPVFGQVLSSSTHDEQAPDTPVETEEYFFKDGTLSRVVVNGKPATLAHGASFVREARGLVQLHQLPLMVKNKQCDFECAADTQFPCESFKCLVRDVSK